MMAKILCLQTVSSCAAPHIVAFSSHILVFSLHSVLAIRRLIFQCFAAGRVFLGTGIAFANSFK